MRMKMASKTTMTTRETADGLMRSEGFVGKQGHLLQDIARSMMIFTKKSTRRRVCKWHHWQQRRAFEMMQTDPNPFIRHRHRAMISAVMLLEVTLEYQVIQRHVLEQELKEQKLKKEVKKEVIAKIWGEAAVAEAAAVVGRVTAEVEVGGLQRKRSKMRTRSKQTQTGFTYLRKIRDNYKLTT